MFYMLTYKLFKFQNHNKCIYNLRAKQIFTRSIYLQELLLRVNYFAISLQMFATGQHHCASTEIRGNTAFRQDFHMHTPRSVLVSQMFLENHVFKHIFLQRWRSKGKTAEAVVDRNCLQESETWFNFCNTSFVQTFV